MTASPEVLTVQVAFHPACPESGAHARALFRLLHGAGLDEPSCWSPIPVRYLCSAAALGAWRKGENVGVIGDHAALVVMVSDLMLVDGAWREALNDCVSVPNTPHHIILPVMLSGAMSLLEPFSGRFDPLRVWHRDDGPLPVVPAAPRPAADPFALLPGVDPARQQLALELRAKAEAHTQEEKKANDARTKWMDRRFDRLRRGFLDALLRSLPRPAGLQPPPNDQTGQEDHPSTAPGDRLVVFLSHAKADGDDIAQWLRDGLGRVSRLQTWYDQNDLRAGAPAAQRMKDAAKSCTGGLVAVHSTAYGTRPWCRIEAEAARRPARCNLTHREGQPSVVLVNQPGVAISQFGQGSWGRGVEALARLPTIGWPGPAPKTEELDAATALVVDRLLLELLQQRRFLLQVEAAAPREGEVFLAFTPDTWTLTEAVRALDPDGSDATERRLVDPI